MFGFIEPPQVDQPVSFFIYSKTGMRTFGRPNQFTLNSSKSDLRQLDSNLRNETSGTKNFLTKRILFHSLNLQ